MAVRSQKLDLVSAGGTLRALTRQQKYAHTPPFRYDIPLFIFTQLLTWPSPLQRVYLNKEASPFGSSPFQNSPRLFWKEQTASPRDRFENSENSFNEDSQLPLSPKRNSIENLKKQSRVKNSSIFAREQMHAYDPTSVQQLDRPLAAGRPLSTSVQGNAFGGAGLNGLRQHEVSPEKGHHRRGESLTQLPVLSSIKTSPAKLPTQATFGSPFSSPTKDRPSSSAGRASPTKSSLVNNGRFNSPQYNPDSSVLSDDDDMKHQTPRALRRHAKSVTFDAAPPTITEYELVTPDPSAASGSREGSYEETDEEEEEEEEEEEMSFDQDDSFDASLEDTEKTPVVLPEDWRHVSPDNANTSLTDLYDDVFDQHETSPMAGSQPNGATSDSRRGSQHSEGSPRPLPPLPGMSLNRPDSSSGEVSRSLPQIPVVSGFSKADLMNRRESSMSLEDRLRLMNFDGDRDISTPTQETHDMRVSDDVEAHADETDADVSVLTADNEHEPSIPRISRESILRRVKSQNFDDQEESYVYGGESSPERSFSNLADLDPDVPIPSRECSSNFDDTAHQEQIVPGSETDSVLGVYQDVDGSAISHIDEYEGEEYEREGSDCSVIRHPVREETEETGSIADDASVSQYSSQPDEHSFEEPVAQTMEQILAQAEEHPEEQPTSQSTIDSSGPPTPTVVAESPSAAEKKARQDEMFANFDREQSMDLSLDPLKASFATAPSPLDTAPKMEAMRDFLQRPATPDVGEAGAEEEYGASDEPGSPDSVIRHPVVISPPEVDSDVEVPQQEATIRGTNGHKLRTRPSLIPDEVDMAATRRQVSGTFPPPVPERSPKRQSLNFEIGHVDDDSSQLSFATKERRMLDLDLGDDSNDLSFGLDNEFDKIIESQKVDLLFPLPDFARFPTSAVARSSAAAHMSGEGFFNTYSPANGFTHEQKGYLMRENTKVVVASSRQFSDEKAPENINAPTSAVPGERLAQAPARKASAERKQAWTTEPWNGKARRKSLRTASGARKARTSGVAPPLPGQESAVAAGLDAVTEQGDDEFEDGEERGRVFVKVIGVKDLDLPLPKSKCTEP